LQASPKASSSSLLDSVKSLFWISQSSIVEAPLDDDPTRVSHAIQQAFTKLDTELLQTPLRILANTLESQHWKNKTIPDLSQHPLALTSMLPAISGMFPPLNMSVHRLTNSR
jgi:pyruvate dehydrogenase phosphatase